MPRGISVHVGVNHPEPTFGVASLQGCIADAVSMRDIATSRGFEATMFLDSEATFQNVSTAILEAKERLEAGDIFLFTFAGHGSFRSILPTTEEDDGQDETILLRDCVLIDNYLRRNLWSQFREGVRILGIADSCHSGTVLTGTMTGPSHGTPGFGGVAGVDAPPPDAAGGGGCEPGASSEPIGLDAQATGISATRSRANRGFTDADRVRIETRNRPLHERLRNELLSGAAARVKASLLSLAACRDNEEALDGPAHGAFTEALLAVWNAGTFTGNYDDFIDGIRARFQPTQQRPLRRPPVVDNLFLQQRPFTIGP